MKRIGIILAGLCLAVLTAQAAHTKAQLLLAAESAVPGTIVMAGVQLKMEAGWHTYWKNPGLAGQATDIKWSLPPGVKAGEIVWPLPEKIPPADVTTYGYENEVVLLVPLTLETNLSPGDLKISAEVSWLECKESCLPANASVSARLNVTDSAKPSPSARLLEEWMAKAPSLAPYFPVQAWWGEVNSDGMRPLHLQWPSRTASADFFPDPSEDFELQGPTEILSSTNGVVHILKLVKKFSGDWPAEVSGVFVSDGTGVQAKAVLGNAPLAAGTTASQPLWRMLIFAFIGGLILNIMPCVLPVIALKILGFVSEAKSEPRRVRQLGIVYSLGVLASFLVLAGIVIGVKAAGQHAGWGMQFGSPVFIVCLTTLVTLVALNLFGVFEFTPGGKVMGAAGELSSRHGNAGAFFNGVLATTLATPCTAPFLAPALGFAFAQSTPIIVLVFLTIGLGLSAPYVLLSWNPAWMKFLPKPGAWMEKFKVAMGFPMLATAVWLFSLTLSSYGKKALWLGVFLVIAAATAWVFGEFVQRGRRRKSVAMTVALVLLAGGWLFALEQQLDWRHPQVEAVRAGSLKESPDGIEWQPWSPEAVSTARAAGKVVLVDFTADWCLTCQVNKKTSIETTAVRQKLKDLGAVALLGDYTRFPPAITDELSRFNRAGVPLVLVYPKNPEASPIVLPEVLTPGIMLDALDRAAK